MQVIDLDQARADRAARGEPEGRPATDLFDAHDAARAGTATADQKALLRRFNRRLRPKVDKFLDGVAEQCQTAEGAARTLDFGGAPPEAMAQVVRKARRRVARRRLRQIDGTAPIVTPPARARSSRGQAVRTRGSRRSYSRAGDSGDDGDGPGDGSPSRSVPQALEREANRPLNPRRLTLRRLARHLRSRTSGRQLSLDAGGVR